MQANPFRRKVLCLSLSLTSFFFAAPASSPILPTKAKGVGQLLQSSPIRSVTQINPSTFELLYANGQRLSIDFYGENIFRLFQDPDGGLIRDPQATPPAQILVNQARRSAGQLSYSDKGKEIVISSKKISLTIDKETSLLKVRNLISQKEVLAFAKPLKLEQDKSTLSFVTDKDEYFYGGGVQNGRFSHKGKVIAIENQNSWTDGGVASPNPFFWSTKGYALLWHTFKKGQYDFASKKSDEITLSHEIGYLDVFLMIDDGPIALLNDFYQLTGHPVLLPKFGFYQGHLNAYNRDYWKEDEKGILFEDGKRYKESQKDNTGIKESLNGEKNNYQFSARAVIDRYKNHDMPLGWILPNDGYGAGYGQTSTLDSNIANLKSFGDYAHKNGVEIGLWTQSDLHPKAGISALLQRDIVKEVRDAGVRVLKTDVAWVGAGYSFGLNGVADVGKIMPYYGQNARPFIISLDGWAGTQRYAGIWSGDQTGGQWEYIRFHIPTYIGSGLSGNPNISSDMDGIFGGKNPAVNTRDFQWKTFSPMQLNMDGWGANEKYPHALGEPFTSINRNYLKLKAELMPYTYSIAKEAVDGLPMIRAMFLESTNPYTLGVSTQYQFMYGPSFLVAPIYQNTKADENGNDIRNGIYLPEGIWIDYLSGASYQGNRILNDFDAPIWKLPIFVKAGAIIPVANPNNNPNEIKNNLRIAEFYPYGKSQFNLYDDDGRTEAYKNGEGLTTLIESDLDAKGNLSIQFHPSKGNFAGFEKNQATELRINCTEAPKSVMAKLGNKKIKLIAVSSLAEFEKTENAYFYNTKVNLNKFATKGTDFEQIVLTKNPQLLVKIQATDITQEQLLVEVKGYKFDYSNRDLTKTGELSVLSNAKVSPEHTGPYSLVPTWDKQTNADYYEIKFQDQLYSTIKSEQLLLDGLKPETDYQLSVRAVNQSGVSDWALINARTKNDPLEFAIRGVVAETSVANQGGAGTNRLFDFDEGNLWHTKWGEKAVPFDLLVDLKSVNQLDKFQYLPRDGAGNGTLLAAKIYYSFDKQNWTLAGEVNWAKNSQTKEFVFTQKPLARYIKLAVTKAVGDFGSGKELYVFKVPGSESYLPGDINNDRLIDRNDLTSYMNYTGLRLGDSDFEGYISKGDINKNNLIDAYDISLVATQIDGKAKPSKEDKVAGKLVLSTAKNHYKKNELVEVVVKGENLNAVNALSFGLPYDPQELEFVEIKANNTAEMENLSYDRLHSNRTKALYPTFVNMGNKKTLSGSEVLFVIKFRAKKDLIFNLKAIDGILVDKNLGSSTF